VKPTRFSSCRETALPPELYLGERAKKDSEAMIKLLTI